MNLERLKRASAGMKTETVVREAAPKRRKRQVAGYKAWRTRLRRKSGSARLRRTKYLRGRRGRLVTASRKKAKHVVRRHTVRVRGHTRRVGNRNVRVHGHARKVAA